MAKRSRPTDPPIETGTPPANGAGARKRAKRLDRKVAKLAVTEARRLEQLTKAQARLADARARLATLRAMDEVVGRTVDPDRSPAGPFGYCMREKLKVEISEPEPVTLSNGRTAVAGRCPRCGVRVVALSTRGAHTDV
jgi:hypothetical protein